MNLEQRISFIKEKLLAMGDIYACTMAARDCLLIIEVAFRELLRRHADKLLPPDRIKLQKVIDQAIGRKRAKGIDDFTLGQLVGIIRDANFFEAWSTATGKPLTGIRWIELNNLNSYRNERLVHVRNMEELLDPKLQVTPSEANFLLYCLNIILETFGIESLENPPVTTDEKSFPHALSQLLPNPYRGLYPFREEDAAYFFGRTDEIQDLVQLVAKRQFIAVLGNSGSGKLSLVFAGLIPQLRQTKQWLIVDCRPKKQPLRELAAALIDALYQAEPNEVARLSEITILEQGLEQQQINLQSIIQRIFDKQPDYSHFLLIIDQFEELYTLAPAEIQPIFLDLLLALIASQVATVLITLRADFLGYALGHAQFAKLLDSYRNKMLSDLNEAGLTDAIKQPAHALDVKFEEGLAERIIRDVGIQAGSLPLLQFALQQLWERREQNQLTLASYEKLGTVTQALAHYAEQVYHYFSEEGQIQLRQLFVQMIRPGEGTEDTRQVMVLPRDSAKHEIIRQLADKRLVITRHDEQTAENTVEIIHETLIRHWQRLRDWMKEDRSFRVWQENLRGYMKDKVLLRDAQLVVAQDWFTKRTTELTKNEQIFIQASVKQRETELAAKRRQQRLWIVFVIAFFVVALGLSGLAWLKSEESKKNEADSRKNLARSEENLATSKRNQSRMLVGFAEIQLKENRPATAMRLTLEALPKFSETYLDRPFVKEAYDFLSRSMNRHYQGIFEQDGGVDGATFSPDGKILLTHTGNNAYLWDMDTRKWLVTFVRHEKSFIRLAEFSPDGKRIITVHEDNTARIWDTNTGKNLFVLLYEDYVYSAKFSPDGKRIVTASEDNTARIWDANTGQTLFVLQHEDEVKLAKFSPDSKRIVTSAFLDKTRIWDANTGKNLSVLRHNGVVVKSAEFSPDGKRIIIASDDSTVRIWDANTGKNLFVLRHDGVQSAEFSPDGKRVVTAAPFDRTVRIWNANTGQNLSVFQYEDSEYALDTTEYLPEFSPDGKHVVTITNPDKKAYILDVNTGKTIAVLQHDDFVQLAKFSPDSKRVVTVSNHTAYIWDANPAQTLAILLHENDVQSAKFCLDGKHIVTVSYSYGAERMVAHIWDTDTRKNLDENDVYSVEFSPDCKHIITTSSDKTVHTWDANTGKNLAVLQHENKVESAKFSPDGKHIVTVSDDKTARIWDANTGQNLAILQHEYNVNSAKFSPSGKHIVTAPMDNTARLWDVSTGQNLSVLQHEDEVNSAEFSPDGKHIVTASVDNTARLWDVSTGQNLSVLQHEDNVRSAEFSPDGKRIVTASSDKTARIWDANTGQNLAILQHEYNVNSAEFSPDGKHVVTASDDDTARIWDANTKQNLAILQHLNDVNSAKFSPDGRHIITASNDGTARIWLTFPTLEEMIEQAKSFLPAYRDGKTDLPGYRLTCAERQRFFLDEIDRCKIAKN